MWEADAAISGYVEGGACGVGVTLVGWLRVVHRLGGCLGVLESCMWVVEAGLLLLYNVHKRCGDTL